MEAAMPITPIRIDASAPAVEVEREPFLEIVEDDGSTTQYTLPKDGLPPTMGLQFLRLMRDFGPDMAAVKMFDEVVGGTEVLDRLASIPSITHEQVDAIMNTVTEMLMKSAQGTAGKKRSNGGRPTAGS